MLSFVSDEALLFVVAYFLGTYLIANYLFSILWRNGFKAGSKKLYLTKMIASATSLKLDSAQKSSGSATENPSTANLSVRRKNYRLLEEDGIFLSENNSRKQGASSQPDAYNSQNSTRSSRHGLFGDDASDGDEISDNLLQINDVQPRRIRTTVALLEPNSYKSTDKIEHPSPLNKSSPTSSSRESQMFHFRYNSEMSQVTPFSPLYNLPNISPYPTPFIRKTKSGEFIPSTASLSEDAVHTPFRSPRHFGSSIMDYDQHSDKKYHVNDNPNINLPESELLGLKLDELNFELKVAAELNYSEDSGSAYSDPLDVLTSRFEKINAKERHHSGEILKAVNRLSAMNCVEAEKREVLFREYEDQDRLSVEASARLEAARVDQLRIEEKVRLDEIQRVEMARLENEKRQADERATAAARLTDPKPPPPQTPAPKGPEIGSGLNSFSASTVPVRTANVRDIVQLPYVTDASALVKWLRNSESRVRDVSLPPEMTHYLTELESLLLTFGGPPLNSGSSSGSGSGSESFMSEDLMCEDEEGKPAVGGIKGMLAVTSMAQKLLRLSAALGGDEFLCVLCKLFRAAVGCVCAGTKSVCVTLVANIIVGMFLVLPSTPQERTPHDPTQPHTNSGPGPSLQDQGGLVFKAMIYGESELCIPHTSGDGVDRSTQRRRLAAVELLGALIGTQSKNSPISVEEGWTWVVRTGKQLESLALCGDSSTQYQECCVALLLFFRQASVGLIARFGWNSVSKVLHAVRAVVHTVSPPGVGTGTGVGARAIGDKGVGSAGGAGQQLCSWLDVAVSSEGVRCALNLRHHEPHVMSSYLIISSVEDSRIETQNIDIDKTGHIMAKVKQLRIQTIPGIFNRLSTTHTSQTSVVAQLLEKMLAASKERIPELLRYTLCKVAAQLVSQAQSEFFIIEDESQSLPIARVAVGLCQIKPELTDVIKAEYYRICPLTVPRQAEGGLVGDDMFENMGFLRLNSTGGWEGSDEWLVRMTKVLCVFSVTLIQPEGMPFCLADGWSWLTNMINACSRIPNPSSYTADALDIFLRIVTPVMIRTYSVKFMELLLITEKEILPKLKEGSSRTRLTEFLQVARESKGRNFLTFFKPVAM